MSNESFDEDALRAALHESSASIGEALDSHAYSEEINLAAMRAEVERRRTIAGRIGYSIMRVVQYFRG